MGVRGISPIRRDDVGEGQWGGSGPVRHGSRRRMMQKKRKTRDPLAMSITVRRMPKLEEPFELEVDASNYAIGATLNQKDERGRWHPVAYYSTTLSETE